jgi:RNA polymerase sigma-70 factor (ECF subfamily)
MHPGKFHRAAAGAGIGGKFLLMEETTSNAQLYRVRWMDGSRAVPKDLGMAPSPEIRAAEVAGPDDLKLLRQARAGDCGAFGELVNHHGDRLYRLACSLLGNAADAEDVVQETFAGAYAGSGAFEGRASVGTWLTRILVRQAARFQRDRKRPMERLEQAEKAPGASASVRLADARMDLQAALQQISPEHRQVLVLREYEQMSYAEIAELLEMPRGTVESRIHRARQEMRERLKAYIT